MAGVTVIGSTALPPAPEREPEDLGPLRPSSVWYWVAGAIALAGIVGGIVLAIVTVVDTIDEVDAWPRIDVPGTADVSLDRGDHTLFLEYPGAYEGYRAIAPDVEVTSPSGVEIPVVRRPYGGTTYSWSGHQGESFASFFVPEDGTYQIEVVSDSEPLQEVAIGQDITGQVVLRVLGGMGIAGLSVIAAGTIVVVTAMRRGKEKRRRRPAPKWNPGSPGVAWAPPPPGAWPPVYAAPPPPGAWPPPTVGYPPPPGAWPPPVVGYPPPPGGSPYPPPPGGSPYPPPPGTGPATGGVDTTPAGPAASTTAVVDEAPGSDTPPPASDPST